MTNVEPARMHGAAVHVTTVTVERRDKVDRSGTVHKRSTRYRGGCRCGWNGSSRQVRRVAEKDAEVHVERMSGTPCGTCGRVLHLHPAEGCARWQYPGQLALDVEGALT